MEKLRFHNQGPFSFVIESGECMGISGASGVGKTLMLRAIMDLDPHEGNIFLDNVESNTVSAPQWRKRVGMLPAECQWWHDTVGEHFRHVDHGLLKRLGFDEDVMKWEIRRLSTGERQRLGLVRLLWKKPQVLLLDEPTASLDAKNVGKAEDIILDYRKESGAGILWVSHDTEQLGRVTDRFYLMRNNGILEEYGS